MNDTTFLGNVQLAIFDRRSFSTSVVDTIAVAKPGPRTARRNLLHCVLSPSIFGDTCSGGHRSLSAIEQS